MDIYQGALEAKFKTFTTEVQSMKHKWLLTTLVYQMKASIDKNTIALTTQTGKPPVDSYNPRTGNFNNRNTPYNVSAWILKKKGESQTKYGIEWHWCTKDHYSGGVVHNGMYKCHKTYDMTHGEKTLMRRRLMARRPKLTQSLLQVPPQTLMQKNCHRVNHYAHQCALRLVYTQR